MQLTKEEKELIEKNRNNAKKGFKLEAKPLDIDRSKSIISQRPDLAPDTSIKEISSPQPVSGLKKAASGLANINPSYIDAASQGANQIAGIVDPQGEGPATVASTALTGASIGSVVPGIGTAIGAVVGLGLGLVKAESNKKQNQANRELVAAGVLGKELQKQSDFRQLRLGQLGSRESRELKF